MIHRLLRIALAMLVGLSACEPLEDAEAPEPPEKPEGPDPIDPTKNVGPITSITPKAALAGQKVTVALRIAGDPAGPGSDVSFGDGIDVIKATEVPGGLDIEISVAPDAAPGSRDVTVVPDDAAPVKAEKGFAVASAMDVAVVEGEPKPGGLVRLSVTAKDGKTFAGSTFTLEPSLPPGTPSLDQIARGTFTTTTGNVVMLGDPLAKPGPLDLIGINNLAEPLSDQFFAVAGVTLVANAPVNVLPNTTATYALDKALATGFFTADFTPPAGQGLIVDAFARPTGPIDPVIYGYGPAGSSDDILDIKRNIPFTPGINAVQESRVVYPITAAAKGFFTVFEKDFRVNAAPLSFELKTFPAPIVPEQAGAHPVNAKQDLGTLSTAVIVTGKLEAGEIDAYQFTDPSARQFQVSIVTDAEVDIIVDHVPNFDDDTTTFSNVEKATSGATSSFPDTLRVVRVSATPNATKPTGNYVLGIRVL
jgi:hypothetical protein